MAEVDLNLDLESASCQLHPVNGITVYTSQGNESNDVVHRKYPNILSETTPEPNSNDSNFVGQGYLSEFVF